MTTDTQTSVDDSPDAVPEPRKPGFVARIAAKALAVGQRFRAWLASRRPRPFATAVMVTGTCVLLGLGTWQMLRTHEKNLLLDRIAAEFDRPPLNLARALPQDAEAWRQLHYKSVTVTGSWMTPAHMMRFGPRVYEGAVGYHLVMPLRLDNNAIIFVNRGFMPEKMAALPPAGERVTLQGVLYEPKAEKPPYVPENIPSRSLWTWIDLVAMGHEVGVRGVVPVILYQGRVAEQDSYPIGGQLPLPSHNRHWHYAVTWYALALALMVIWMIASNPKQESAQAVAAQPAETDKDLSDPVARRNKYPEATD